jgi:hypothetical protein
MPTITTFKKPPTAAFLIALMLNIALWIFAVSLFPQHEAAVLHYSVNVGIDFIGEGQQIIILPLIGLLALIGNSILGAAIYKTDITSAWLAWGTAPVIQLILIGAFFLIWRANS